MFCGRVLYVGCHNTVRMIQISACSCTHMDLKRIQKISNVSGTLTLQPSPVSIASIDSGLFQTIQPSGGFTLINLQILWTPPPFSNVVHLQLDVNYIAYLSIDSARYGSGVITSRDSIRFVNNPSLDGPFDASYIQWRAPDNVPIWYASGSAALSMSNVPNTGNAAVTLRLSCAPMPLITRNFQFFIDRGFALKFS